jgi:hypothetical protein
MKFRRAKTIALVALVLLLVIFVPPNINGSRFRDQLAPALSAALGRQVRIGTVKYRLFPRPGFDLYDFQVMDDPQFGAEPMLMCGKVTADLRLTSLWQGRLEFANLKLTDDAAPPSLNLSYWNGHWNLESLLAHAEQVPSAPTANRRAEQRPRFPYIAATGGRINFKNGAEKKSYTLASTDFAVWLASEDVWHVRLEGRPVRTDMNLSDTGTVKLEGDLRRAQSFEDMPVNLDLSWEKTQLGQFSKLLLGQDRGWRGDLGGRAEITGNPQNLHVVANLELERFHRYDVNRAGMPGLRTRCLGDYAKAALEIQCETGFEPGSVLLRARWSRADPRDYDLSIVASHVPLATVAAFTRNVRASLPDDLTATGDLNASFGLHFRNGRRDWHGAGMTSPFLLESAVADNPFPVSAVKFHLGPAEAGGAPIAKNRKAPLPAPRSPSESFTIDAFSIQLGPSTALDVEGSVDSLGYRATAKGMVPLERLLTLGRVAGLSTDTPAFTASAVTDFTMNGAWGSPDPPRILGIARIQNLTAWIPGVKSRLVLTHADAQLTDSTLVLSHLSAEFEHSSVAFTGTISRPRGCQAVAPCPLQFDLHAGTLAVSSVTALLGTGDRGWSLPFLSSSGKLPDFRATGTLAAEELRLSHVPLEKFNASIEIGEQSILLNHIAARIGGGSVAGDWRGDWSGTEPHFTSSGNLSGVSLERVAEDVGTADFRLLASWLSGQAQVKYSLRCDGKSAQEMWANATGRADFKIGGGSSHELLLEASKPIRFQSLEGAVELEKQSLKLLPTRIRADNRIYNMSGTVTLSDRQADLKVSNSVTRWEITGALDKPEIAAQPSTAQTTSAHPQ